MSLEWCKEHCPKIHHLKGVQPQHTVGRVYFRKRPEDFNWAFIDWVEDQLKQSSVDLAAPLTRPLRIEMRKKWFEMWDDNQPRL